jgi:hypothetical protein
MGSLCSKAEAKYEVPEVTKTGSERNNKQGSSSNNAGTSASSSKEQKKTAGPPDFGLASTHDVLKLLGKGGEGETWLVRDKQTGHECAAKLIKRPIPKPALAVIKREIKIQSDLGQGHLNLVSADEVILTKTHLGLIMEYVPGELCSMQAIQTVSCSKILA